MPWLSTTYPVKGSLYVCTILVFYSAYRLHTFPSSSFEPFLSQIGHPCAVEREYHSVEGEGDRVGVKGTWIDKIRTVWKRHNIPSLGS